MTISLAVDNTNVTELGVNNLNDVVAMMRTLADQMEAGEYGSVEMGTFILGGDVGVMSFHWGGGADAHERIGFIERAKFNILRELEA